MDLATALAGPWLIQEESLSQILAIANRENDITPEALEKIRGEQLRRAERATMRDGVAIIHATGPLFKRANIFTEISGATSYEIMMRDLAVAADDPSVGAIMLYIDSPGGHASGCDEMAQAVYAVRGKKPIEAYVSGVGASAAYWIATAADKVTISDASAVGSIGVVMTMQDSRKAEESRGRTTYTFVSSQSPDKVPDPATEPGRASIQKTVDALAEVFVSAVAKHRGVSAEEVVTKFGAGGVEIGAKAVSLGMADAVGQFEDALAALAKRGSRRGNPLIKGGSYMSNQQTGGATANEVDLDKARADAAAQATEQAMARVQAILNCESAKDHPALAKAIAFNTTLSLDAATKLMAAAAEDKPKAETTTQTADQREQNYLANKPGAQLGVPGHQAGVAPTNPWASAVGNINKRFG